MKLNNYLKRVLNSKLLVFASILIILSASNLKCEDWLCGDYCANTLIKTAVFIHLECEIYVTYLLCDFESEELSGQVEITNVSWAGVGCDYIPDSKKMEYAIRAVLWQSYEDLGRPSNPYKLNFFLPRCWDNDESSFIPCDYCCGVTYTLTTTNGYTEILNRQLIFNSPDVCHDEIGPNCDYFCQSLHDIPLNTNIFEVNDACTDCNASWNAAPGMCVNGTVSGCSYLARFATRVCGNPARNEVIIWIIETYCTPLPNIQSLYNAATKEVLKFIANNYTMPDDWYIRSTCFSQYNVYGSFVSCGDFSSCCSRRYSLASGPAQIISVDGVSSSCSSVPPGCSITCGYE